MMGVYSEILNGRSAWQRKGRVGEKGISCDGGGRLVLEGVEVVFWGRGHFSWGRGCYRAVHYGEGGFAKVFFFWGCVLFFS